MFVSKNGLSFIDLFAIEFEAGRERPLHVTELFDRSLFGLVTSHSEVAFTCNGNLDFVSLFEIESFDDHSRKTHRQTVTPFGDLHKDIPESIVYPSELWRNRAGPSSQPGNVEIAIGLGRIRSLRLNPPYCLN